MKNRFQGSIELTCVSVKGDSIQGYSAGECRIVNLNGVKRDFGL